MESNNNNVILENDENIEKIIDTSTDSNSESSQKPYNTEKEYLNFIPVCLSILGRVPISIL